MKIKMSVLMIIGGILLYSYSLNRFPQEIPLEAEKILKVILLRKAEK